MFIIRKTRFTVALMWALIPLTVFGSIPRMGCICANGQHKFFCQRHANSDADGRCDCCYGTTNGKNRTAAASQTTGATCCRCSRNRCASEFPTVHSDRPCRPVLDKPVFLGSTKASLDLDQADSTPLFVTFESVPTIVAEFVADIHRGELLPPPDLVFTFSVLLI